MKKLVCFLILSVAGMPEAPAQNLVSNPSFEESVPDSINGSTGNGDISKAAHWMNPGPGSPDYFNSAYARVPLNEAGTQLPHSGKAYAGIYTFEAASIPNVREYINTQLSSPLEANQTYRISLFASLADFSGYASVFGISLSENQTNTFDSWLMLAPWSMQPQNAITDKQHWTELSWIYQAQGGEHYLTIGGFTADSALDTLVVGGDYPNAYYFIDDVSVTIEHPASTNDPDPAPGFLLYPNPVSDVLTLEITGPVSTDQLILTDEWGRTVTGHWTVIGTHTYQVAVSDWTNGVYFISTPAARTQRLIKR